MKTVPLHGKKAAGRVALVDDEDYDLVMQYHWNVRETLREPPKHNDGPYAFASIGAKQAGKRTVLYMHCLIMGTKGVDHVDHDGLNNQKYNLRPATDQQNRRNTRHRVGYSSQYKGVWWDKLKSRWHATITISSKSHTIGLFDLEIEAALAYDDAAREEFGEFAYVNFPHGVSQAERDRLRAEGEAIEAAREAEKLKGLSARAADWWARRVPETRVCTVCGGDYLTTTPKPSLYCGGACAKRAQRQRERARAGAA